MLSPEQAGYLFCFKLASRINYRIEQPHRVLFQLAVRAATGSDIVHVEIVRVSPSQTAEWSYNFLARGCFQDYHSRCLTDAYVHVFLPLTLPQLQAGDAYLGGILGEKYNFLGLIPAWWHQFYPPQPALRHDNVQGGRVFCSEAALWLLYKVGVYQGGVQPEDCTPAQFYDILIKCPCRLKPPPGAPSRLNAWN